MEPNGHFKPRILALDMDDTLLNSDLSISYKTRNAIKRAEQEGVTVVLASGRVYEAMENFVRLLDLDKRPGYLICNNGALIIESHTNNIIYEAWLDKEMIFAVCDLAEAEGFPVQMYDNEIIFVSEPNKYSNLDQQATGLRQVVVENFKDMVGEGCYKLLIPGEPEYLKNVSSMIHTYFGGNITLSYSKPYFLELMPKDTNKGTALAKIAEILNVDSSQAIAIGDSMNDEAMIKWAGIGVAMANGDEHIKNIANFVTERTNDEDGVAEVIEKFFFSKG
jgi:Cof subfamily protein (haloacid dehalogenase superfamily)